MYIYMCVWSRPRLSLLSSPFSASRFPILEPRGKAKPPVNLNRYNSCRPKQYTEEKKTKKNIANVSRQRLRQCAREAAVNCKCGLDANVHVHQRNRDAQTKQRQERAPQHAVAELRFYPCAWGYVVLPVYHRMDKETDTCFYFFNQHQQGGAYTVFVTVHEFPLNLMTGLSGWILVEAANVRNIFRKLFWWRVCWGKFEQNLKGQLISVAAAAGNTYSSTSFYHHTLFSLS